LQCHGYLLSRKRLEGIQASPATSIEQLKQEVINESQPDTTEAIRCPRCMRKMDKNFIEAPASLHIDVCRECDFIWLDGGELGRLQLAHEMKPQAQEARRFRERLKAMTAEEREQFEADMAKLPDEKKTLPLLFSMLSGRGPWGLRL
jgi:Zn-finger nucleic acid-binding protein